jgi:hypothetical protein
MNALIHSNIHNIINSTKPVISTTAPFENGTEIYIIDNTTNQYVYYTGYGFTFTSEKSIATVFKVFNNPSVYNNNLGGVALQVSSGINANKGFLRHSDYFCFSDPFSAGNYDFSWRFDNVIDSSNFTVFNWFPGFDGISTYYLSNFFGYLYITTDVITEWRIEIHIPEENRFTILRKFTPTFDVPFMNGTRLRLVHDSTNQYVCFTGSYFELTNDIQKSMTFVVINNPDVFNQAGGGIALQLVFNSMDTLCLAYVPEIVLCNVTVFEINSIDISWIFFPDPGNPNRFVITANGGYSTFLDLDSGTLTVTTTQRYWRIENSFGL